MTIIICKHCGKYFKVAPSFAKRGKKYCSNACRIADGYQAKYLTNDMYEFLCKNASSHTIKELVKMLKEQLNIDIEKKQLAQYCIKMHIQYKFEKLNKSHSNIPTVNGTIVNKTDGNYLKIKTGSHKWEYLQRKVYEKYYDIKLKDDEYVIFLNQNRRDFSKDNLLLVSQQESGDLCNYGDNIFSTNRELTKLANINSKLKLKIKELKNENNIF